MSYRINLKKTPQQIELVKAMASPNKEVAARAREMFAAFIGPVCQKVLLNANTSNLFFKDVEYDADDYPSIPLDLFYNEGSGYVQVWSQAAAGGMPTSEVSGMNELKFSTYNLTSSVSFDAVYAKRGRLDVPAKAVERMINEVSVRQERNAYAVLLKAVADARTNSADHIILSTTASTLVPNDLLRMKTLSKRITMSYANGTPAAPRKGITDLVVSPEIIELILAWSFSSNDASGNNIPASAREQLYRSAGNEEIFGITLHSLLELGTSRKYNTLFGTFAPAGVSHSAADFDPAADEVTIGLDMTADALLRPVAVQDNSQFSVQSDDQFAARAKKISFWGEVTESRVVTDGRALTAMIV